MDQYPARHSRGLKSEHRHPIAHAWTTATSAQNVPLGRSDNDHAGNSATAHIDGYALTLLRDSGFTLL
jgi:hypothetical protein